jgi:hypothetical protein
MNKSFQIFSPLAEKRVILFKIRKQIVGRRAYSDSVHSQKSKEQIPDAMDSPCFSISGGTVSPSKSVSSKK